MVHVCSIAGKIFRPERCSLSDARFQDVMIIFSVLFMNNSSAVFHLILLGICEVPSVQKGSKECSKKAKNGELQKTLKTPILLLFSKFAQFQCPIHFLV